MVPFIKRTTLWDSTTLSTVDFSSGVRAVPGHKQTDSAINKSVTSRILPLMVCSGKEKGRSRNSKKRTCEASNGKANPVGGGPGEKRGGRGTARGAEDGGSGKEMEAREGEAGRWG